MLGIGTHVPVGEADASGAAATDAADVVIRKLAATPRATQIPRATRATGVEVIR